MVKFPFTTNSYLKEAENLAKLLHTTFELKNVKVEYMRNQRDWTAEFIGFGSWIGISPREAIKKAIKQLKETLRKEGDCDSCRFNGDLNCNVGTYLANQGKKGVCFGGEFWQKCD